MSVSPERDQSPLSNGDPRNDETVRGGKTDVCSKTENKNIPIPTINYLPINLIVQVQY